MNDNRLEPRRIKKRPVADCRPGNAAGQARMSKRKVLAEEVGVVAFPLPANRIRFNVLRITVKLIAGKGNEVMKILLKEAERSAPRKIAHSFRRPRLEAPYVPSKRMRAPAAKDYYGMKVIWHNRADAQVDLRRIGAHLKIRLQDNLPERQKFDFPTGNAREAVPPRSGVDRHEVISLVIIMSHHSRIMHSQSLLLLSTSHILDWSIISYSQYAPHSGRKPPRPQRARRFQVLRIFRSCGRFAAILQRQLAGTRAAAAVLL